jgi:Rod binding domain-containing protein
VRLRAPEAVHGGAAEVREVARAAREFESYLLGELFSRMRPKSEDPLFGGGFGAEAMRSLLDEEMGRIAAQAGGIGLQSLLAQRAYRKP